MENRKYKQHNQQSNKRKGGAIIIGPKETVELLIQKLNECIALREKEPSLIQAREKLVAYFKESDCEKLKGMKRDERRIFLSRKVDVDPAVFEGSQVLRFYSSPVSQTPNSDPAMVKEMDEREKKAVEGTKITLNSTFNPIIIVDRLTKTFENLKASIPENYYYIYGLEPAFPLYSYLVGHLGNVSEERKTRSVGVLNLPRGFGDTDDRPWEIMVRTIKSELHLDLGPIGHYAYQKELQKVDRVPRSEIYNLISLPPLDKVRISFDEKDKLVQLSIDPSDPMNDVIKKFEEFQASREDDQSKQHYSNRSYSNNRGGGRGNYSNNRGGGSRGNYSNNRGGGRGNYSNNRDGGNRGNYRSYGRDTHDD